MENKQVLIMSFWNPTPQMPQQGIFIQDQVAAVCNLLENVVFLQVNVLYSNCLFIKRTFEESPYYGNKRIIISLYSFLWKFIYVNPWHLARLIYRILNKEGIKISPAIIHSNVIFPCGVVGYLLARRFGSKLVISEHWSKAEKLLKHPLFRRIALKAYHQNFAIICVSKFLSKMIVKATGHRNAVVIPNIINTEVFTFLPKPASDNGTLSFICVASWRYPKRLDLIVRALCDYASETSGQVKLRIVGSGIQAEKLKNLQIPGNLHIEWLGYLDKPAIANLLHTTMVFMHASNIETFSIGTAEALLTGTPVLASNVGALPELINDNNGILVENSTEFWLKGIREIVTKKFDYEAIAKEYRDKFSPAAVGKSIISIYREATNELSL
jgi:glycosyltransferase involved in cell wall biosynthesis